MSVEHLIRAANVLNSGTSAAEVWDGVFRIAAECALLGERRVLYVAVGEEYDSGVRGDSLFGERDSDSVVFLCPTFMCPTYDYYRIVRVYPNGSVEPSRINAF